jgi:hypothetical protein
MREEEPEKKLAQQVSFASLGMCVVTMPLPTLKQSANARLLRQVLRLVPCSRPHPINHEAITA